ncbi:MAG: cytochrome c [Casimicrobiaceae bacterium]
MARMLLQVSFAAVLVAASASAPAQDGSPERGYKLYMEKMCFTCHGTAGQGGERGSGPQVAPSAWPLEAFAQQLRHPRQDMPRYTAKFVSDAEVADIHAYLKSIKPWRAAKDIELLRAAP